MLKVLLLHVTDELLFPLLEEKPPELPELDEEELLDELELLLDDEQDLQHLRVPPHPLEQDVVPQEQPVSLGYGVQQVLQLEYLVTPFHVQAEAPAAAPQLQDL